MSRVSCPETSRCGVYKKASMVFSGASSRRFALLSFLHGASSRVALRVACGLSSARQELGGRGVRGKSRSGPGAKVGPWRNRPMPRLRCPHLCNVSRRWASLVRRRKVRRIEVRFSISLLQILRRDK